jgi:hypothetical protein
MIKKTKVFRKSQKISAQLKNFSKPLRDEAVQRRYVISQQMSFRARS